MRFGLVKLSGAQFASEHTQPSSRVNYSQKSFVIRSWVYAFRERPFLKASCIVLMSTSTTVVLPLRQPGWVVVASLSTSCNANVSLTLIYRLCHAAGKSAATLKTENVPNGPQGAPYLGRGVRSPCDGQNVSGGRHPVQRVLTSNHLSISNRRPLRSNTAIEDKFFRPSERLNASIWRYIWCVYRLAGGTASDILVHFPASFSSWLSDILRLSIASRRIASSFSSLSSGT